MTPRWAALAGALEFASGGQETIRRKQASNVLRLSCLDLSDGAVASYIVELQKFQPTWLYSIPSTVTAVVRYIRDNSVELSLPSLQLVELGSEYLSEDVRDNVQSVFGVRPCSQYACQEVWGMAFECRRGRLHVLGDHVPTVPPGRLAPLRRRRP